ncbi:MscL family protein [candidate division WWE3 bacterium]|nr:MscL family protein [candidate division WWE3 bacterium]
MKQLKIEKVSAFIEFVREQGVVGLAVGFILGGAVSKVVTSLVSDIINPVLGVILGFAGNLIDAKLVLGTVIFPYGHFLTTLIDLAVIAAVVYFGVKGLGLDNLDKKK